MPLSLDQAVDRIREAVSLRVEATQSLRAMPDPDRASRAEATSRMEKAEPAVKSGESASGPAAASKTGGAAEASAATGGQAGESEVDVNKTLVLSKESVASKLSI
jgi:hypothetical protein